MIFTVLWSSDAEQRLAQLWIDAADREAITSAAHEIDSRLKNDAVHLGEARSEGQGFVAVPPLAVYFRVSMEDRTVRVLTVRRARWSVSEHE